MGSLHDSRERQCSLFYVRGKHDCSSSCSPLTSHDSSQGQARVFCVPHDELYWHNTSPGSICVAMRRTSNYPNQGRIYQTLLSVNPWLMFNRLTMVLGRGFTTVLANQSSEIWCLLFLLIKQHFIAEKLLRLKLFFKG
jgi:hypothetical protein